MKTKALFESLLLLLQKSKVKFDKELLYTELLSHPNYPYLNSVADALNAINVDSIFARISIEELVKNGAPALIHCPAFKNKILVLEKITEVNASLYDTSKNGSVVISLNELEDVWDGFVLYLTGYKGNVNWQTKINLVLNQYKWFLLFCSLSILGGSFLWEGRGMQNYYFYGGMCLNIGGFIVSILLIKHELNQITPWLKKLCSINNSVSCDDVLNSKGAKFVGVIKLADVGLIYFAGSICVLIIGEILQRISLYCQYLAILAGLSFFIYYILCFINF